MKKLSLTTRRWIRGILMGSSLTAIAFVFHACYGTPEDFGYDIKLTGTVLSKITRQPIKGIKVSQGENYDITDQNGNFSFYTYIDTDRYYYYEGDHTYCSDSIPVLFSDIDGVENGYFIDKEIIIDPARKDEIKINVELDEKN
ncbi:MAG: hypothetical protein LBN18_07265 [Dysgonamonadaceae bacterium]|jgi:hypothetical protein|nr:hypothetical protein [Dysgonamonadaceae bacterium]